MSWGKVIQEGLHETRYSKGREKGRREERKRWEESLKNQNVDREIIRNIRKFSDSRPKIARGYGFGSLLRVLHDFGSRREYGAGMGRH